MQQARSGRRGEGQAGDSTTPRYLHSGPAVISAGMENARAKTSATLIGLGAIALWSVLALMTAASGKNPPFELAALTFAIGGLMGLAYAGARGRLGALVQPWPVWLVGVGGLFGYHALYFAALRAAPPADASLIAYLWPLLIVLMSALLPGEHLHRQHLIGAALGFLGVAILLVAG